MHADAIPKVLCAGIVVVDHVCSPIDHLPSAGELVLTENCQIHIGGCAANVALDLERLGVASRVIGCVGDDLFGDFARQTLARRGVDPAGLAVIPGVPTSQTLVVNVMGQDRRFVHLRGANDQLSASRIRDSLTPKAQVLYVGGLFLMNGLDAGELADTFRVARSVGLATALDVVTPGPADYRTPLGKILPETDYFFPNEDEARLMTGHGDPADQARCFADLGARHVVVTRGAGGCEYLSRDGGGHVEAFPVNFVDGTGGGDAFVAGFISGLIENRDMEDCLRRGSALGASCVRAMGATEGVCDRAELDRLLLSHDLPLTPRPTSRGGSDA